MVAHWMILSLRDIEIKIALSKKDFFPKCLKCVSQTETWNQDFPSSHFIPFIDLIFFFLSTVILIWMTNRAGEVTYKKACESIKIKHFFGLEMSCSKAVLRRDIKLEIVKSYWKS